MRRRGGEGSIFFSDAHICERKLRRTRKFFLLLERLYRSSLITTPLLFLKCAAKKKRSEAEAGGDAEAVSAAEGAVRGVPLVLPLGCAVPVRGGESERAPRFPAQEVSARLKCASLPVIAYHHPPPILFL